MLGNAPVYPFFFLYFFTGISIELPPRLPLPKYKDYEYSPTTLYVYENAVLTENRLLTIGT